MNFFLAWLNCECEPTLPLGLLSRTSEKSLNRTDGATNYKLGATLKVPDDCVKYRLDIEMRQEVRSSTVQQTHGSHSSCRGQIKGLHQDSRGLIPVLQQQHRLSEEGLSRGFGSTVALGKSILIQQFEISLINFNYFF